MTHEELVNTLRVRTIDPDEIPALRDELLSCVQRNEAELKMLARLGHLDSAEEAAWIELQNLNFLAASSMSSFDLVNEAREFAAEQLRQLGYLVQPPNTAQNRVAALAARESQRVTEQ